MSIISPEEDILTWLMVFSQSINNAEQFHYCVVDFQRLALIIIKSGDFPPSYKIETEKFINKMIKQVLCTVLNSDNIDAAQHQDVKLLLLCFIKLIKICYQRCFSNLNYLCEHLLNEGEKLYQESPEIYVEITQSFSKSEDFNFLLEEVTKMNLLMLSKLCIPLFVGLQLHDEKTIEKGNRTILRRNMELLFENQRGDSGKQVTFVYEWFIYFISHRENIYTEEMNIVFETILYQMHTNIFDHVNSSLKNIVKLITFEKYKQNVIEFLVDSDVLATIIIEVQQRSEFSNNKQKIILFASENDIFTPHIDELWGNTNFEFLYTLIPTILMKCKEKDTQLHMKHLLGLKKDQKWINFIMAITDKNVFSHDITKNIIDALDEVITKDVKLKNIALKLKTKLTAKSINEEEFNLTVNNLTKKNVLDEKDLIFLSEILSKFKIIDLEKKNTLYKMIYEMFLSEKYYTLAKYDMCMFYMYQDYKPTIIDAKTFISNYYSFEDEGILKDLEMQALEHTFDPDLISNAILQCLDIIDESAPFVNFVTSLFMRERIKKAPIKYERLLFELAFMPKANKFINNIISYFLCSELEDEEMIKYFIECWSKRISSPNSYRIMIKFIQTCEERADLFKLNLINHQMFYEQKRKQVTLTYNKKNTVFDTGENTYISSLILTAANYFGLNYKNVELFFDKERRDPNEILYDITSNSEIEFTVNITEQITEMKVLKAIPSIILSQSDVFNILYEQMNSKQCYHLLDLVAVPASLEEKILNEKDLTKLFPVSNPYKFKYNFIVFTSEFSGKLEDDIVGLNIPQYLADSLTTINVKSLIKKILDFIINFTENIEESKLFDTLIKISPSFPKQVSKIIPKLHVTNIDIILNMLLEDDKDLRQCGRTILASLKVPVRKYVTLFNGTKYYPEGEFYLSLIEHSKEKDQGLLVIIDEIFKGKCKVTEEIAKFVSYCFYLDIIDETRNEALAKFITKNVLDINTPQMNKNIFCDLISILKRCRRDQIHDAMNNLIGITNFRKFMINGEDLPMHKEKHFAGIYNSGASCFVNSVLQVLCHSNPFISLIMCYSEKNKFLNELVKITGNILWSNSKAINIQGFYDMWNQMTNIKTTAQQDANEFILKLIEIIGKELPEDKFNKVFNGRIKTIIKGQGKRVEKTEKLGIMPLDLDKSIVKALQVLGSEESISYTFEGDSDQKPATISKLIEELPQLFIVQLKRFSYDYDRQRRIKNRAKTDITETFKFMDKTYELSALVMHKGSAESGHYTSSILFNGSWWFCNDDEITKTKEKKIHGEPYILFYTCTDDNGSYSFISQYKTKVQEENMINNTARICLTKAFHDVMISYSISQYPNYQILAVRYFFDFSAFSTDPSRETQLANNIISLLTDDKEDELKLLITQEFSNLAIENTLLLSPHKEVRVGASIILTFFFQSIMIKEYVICILQTRDKWLKCKNSNELFSVLLVFAENKEMLDLMLCNKIDEYVAEAIKIPQDSTNGILLLIKMNKITKAVVTVIKAKWEVEAIREGTDPDAIVKFLKLIPDKDKIKRIVISNASNNPKIKELQIIKEKFEQV